MYPRTNITKMFWIPFPLIMVFMQLRMIISSQIAAIIIINVFSENTENSGLVNNYNPSIAPIIQIISRRMIPSLTGDMALKYIYSP